MPRGKKEQAEQIIPKLREVEVDVGRGKTVAEAVKKIGVTEQTYSRIEEEVWRPPDRPGEAAEGPREGEQPTEAVVG